MDAKKNKKKILITSIISIVLIAIIITVGVIFGVLKKEDSKNSTPTSNVNQSNIISEAIALGLVSKNYDGEYEFSGVRNVKFNSDLTEEQIQSIYKLAGGKNRNDFIYYLHKEKINELNGNKEILKFESTENYGKFTKIGNTYAVGNYVGDESLTLITLFGSNEQIFVSLKYTELTSSSLSDNSQNNQIGTKLYLFKKVYSSTNPDQLLFEITYEYTKLVNTSPVIPDEDINFKL